MKTFIGLAVIGLVYSVLTVVAISKRESCTVNSDCTTTQCAGGSSIICQHPNGTGIVAGGGLCTCASTTQCTTKEDCYAANIDLTCPNAERHCYDNRCICSRFPPGGK